MRFPLVSRERLDLAEKQLADSEAERRRLLDLLLRDTTPVRRQAATVTEDDGIRAVTSPEEGSAVAFTTPIDRVLSRFDQAHKGGKIPAQFKARSR